MKKCAIYKLVCLFLVFVPIAIHANETASKNLIKDEYHYLCPPGFPFDVWQSLQPYFLPSNHPIKKKLDMIFKRSRVTANSQSVKSAGFEKAARRPYSSCTVSPHPALKGYLVKMYTDDVPDVVDYEQWVWRIEGARQIQASIHRHGYEAFFKVPKKWIYPLPLIPPARLGTEGKKFILIVEDMGIYRSEKNRDKWKGEQMHKKRMEALFVIMQENGLSDSIYAFNIPFCKDGKQAFIDTEHHHKWPIHFDKLTSAFAPKMAEHWKFLISQEGPH